MTTTSPAYRAAPDRRRHGDRRGAHPRPTRSSRRCCAGPRIGALTVAHRSIAPAPARRCSRPPINPRGLTLLGFELGRIYLLVWAIYGLLVGVAGVLLGCLSRRLLGQCRDPDGQRLLDRRARRARQRARARCLAAYCIGYLETITAYLVSPCAAQHPGPDPARRRGVGETSRLSGAAMMGRDARRPPAFGQATDMKSLLPLPAALGQHRSPGPWLPRGTAWSATSYEIGVLIPAFYFAVFAMSLGPPVRLCGRSELRPDVPGRARGLWGRDPQCAQFGFGVPLSAWLSGPLLAVVGGVLLALPALRLSGPYFGLITLVAVLLLQQMVTVFADLDRRRDRSLAARTSSRSTTTPTIISRSVFSPSERRRDVRPVALARPG